MSAARLSAAPAPSEVLAAAKSVGALAIVATDLLDGDGEMTGSHLIEELGASLADVIRTRVLLTRIDDWKVIAAVHGEFFRNVRPANTIMQVARFIDSDWLLETEVDAVVRPVVT
jgi:hypothetical protein